MVKPTQALLHLIFTGTPWGKLLFVSFSNEDSKSWELNYPVLWLITVRAFTQTYVHMWHKRQCY